MLGAETNIVKSSAYDVVINTDYIGKWPVQHNAIE